MNILHHDFQVALRRRRRQSRIQIGPDTLFVKPLRADQCRIGFSAIDVPPSKRCHWPLPIRQVGRKRLGSDPRKSKYFHGWGIWGYLPYYGLKIHVSPVQLRLCPLSNCRRMLRFYWGVSRFGPHRAHGRTWAVRCCPAVLCPAVLLAASALHGYTPRLNYERQTDYANCSHWRRRYRS